MSEHSTCPIGIKKTPAKKHLGFIPSLGLWRYKEMFYYRLRGLLSKKVLVLNNMTKKILIKSYGYHKNKIFHCHYGINIEEFSPNTTTRNIMRAKFGLNNDTVLIISAGRLAKEKCIYKLLNAFDQIIKIYSNSQLYIIGDGPLKNELIELANNKPSKEKIKFFGYLSNISDFLKMSDIFVLPSEFEGLGTSLLEAMGTGLIVIANNIPGPNEFVKNGINGFLFEKSEESLSDNLLKAISLSGGKKNTISLNAQKTIKENFDLKKNIKKELEVFNLIV